MACDFRVIRFAGICEHSAFGPRFSGDLYAADGNVGTLRTTDISSDGRIEYKTMPLARLDMSRLQQHVLREDDLVITRSGRVGTAAVFKGFRLPVLPGAFLIRFRLKRDVADSRFYRYFFNSPFGQELLSSVATGSVQQNLNITSLHGLDVPLPGLDEQRAIAHILATLDDKIELNRRMSETLGAMAQVLFKSWFVDFDPVRAKAKGRDAGLPTQLADLFPSSVEDTELGEIPKGWAINTIEAIATRVGMGPFGSSIKVDSFVPSGIPIISGQHLHGFMLEDTTFNFVSNEHAARLHAANVQRGDVVFTHAGNIGQVAYIPKSSRYERYVLSQRQFFMRCDLAQVTPTFITFYFKSAEGQHRLLANTSSSGVPSIARPVTYLRSIRLTIPPKPLMAAFERLVEPLLTRFRHNMDESRTLAALRDALLPKLISGELRVKDAERMAAQVNG